jgi:uncharacterized protein involved in exopolysaccharide biosynthesis
METNKNFDAPELKLHFLDYWRIIRIRKTVILAVFLLVAITTTLVTFILPPTFASTVRISVEKDATDISGLDGQRASFGFDPYWIQTQFEKLTSKMLLHQVITNLDLSRKWGEKYKEGELRLDTTYGLLKRATSVNQSRNTSLIEIRVDSDDPVEAAVIANKIAEIYRDSRLYRWRENSSKGLENLQAKYTNQNEQISRLQTELEDMRRTNGISEITEAGTVAAKGLDQETLIKLETERIQTEADFSKVRSSYDSLTNQTRAELRKTIATVAGDPSFNALLDQLYSAEQKLAIMTNSLGMENTEVKSVRALLETINRQVEDWMARRRIWRPSAQKSNQQKARIAWSPRNSPPIRRKSASSKTPNTSGIVSTSASSRKRSTSRCQKPASWKSWTEPNRRWFPSDRARPSTSP